MFRRCWLADPFKTMSAFGVSEWIGDRVRTRSNELENASIELRRDFPVVECRFYNGTHRTVDIMRITQEHNALRHCVLASRAVKVMLVVSGDVFHFYDHLNGEQKVIISPVHDFEFVVPANGNFYSIHIVKKSSNISLSNSCFRALTQVEDNIAQTVIERFATFKWQIFPLPVQYAFAQYANEVLSYLCSFYAEIDAIIGQVIPHLPPAIDDGKPNPGPF